MVGLPAQPGADGAAARSSLPAAADRRSSSMPARSSGGADAPKPPTTCADPNADTGNPIPRPLPSPPAKAPAPVDGGLASDPPARAPGQLGSAPATCSQSFG